MRQYIVDAFTSKPFSGNPAAVCVTDRPLSDAFMRNLAMENNLSETAYLLKEADDYNLRWFTPRMEVDLCGHATLASSFVVLNFLEPESDVVRFQTRSGLLTVRRVGGLYRMDFPIYEQEEIAVTDAMEKAFGARPIRAYLGVDLVCVFENEETVRTMTPDQTKLSGLPDASRTQLHGEEKQTVSPGASARNSPSPRIRSAVRPTVRSRRIGRGCSERTRSPRIRHRNAAARSFAS